MVIEYAGELIRSTLTDKRERLYDSRNIGCYMFKIDDNLVVDATMRGNAARFINHSCEVCTKRFCSQFATTNLKKKQILICRFTLFYYSPTAIRRLSIFLATSISLYLHCVALSKAKSSPMTINSHLKKPKFLARVDLENVENISTEWNEQNRGVS